MNILRKAGQAIRDFDDSYSEKIANFYLDRFDKSSKTTADVIKSTIGLSAGGAIPSTKKFTDVSAGNKSIENALGYAMPAVSAVSKYVLPAAGVTLAGKGLYDLTIAFGSPADGQEPNQLSL